MGIAALFRELALLARLTKEASGSFGLEGAHIIILLPSNALTLMTNVIKILYYIHCQIIVKIPKQPSQCNCVQVKKRVWARARACARSVNLVFEKYIFVTVFCRTKSPLNTL